MYMFFLNIYLKNMNKIKNYLQILEHIDNLQYDFEGNIQHLIHKDH